MFRSLLVVLLLAGCSNLVGPNRNERIRADWQRVGDTCRSLLTDQRLNAIRGKIPDQPMQASFDQLSNTAKPTQEEIPVIKLRADLFLQCAAANREVFTRNEFPAPYVTAHDLSVNRISTLYAGLVSQELTWGQFMRQAQEQVLARQKAMQDLDAAYRAQSQADADRALRNYQIIQSLQPPRPITCYRMGAYTTCQ